MNRIRVPAVFALTAGLFFVLGDTSAQLPGQPKVVQVPKKLKVVPVPGQPFPLKPVAGPGLPVVPRSAAAFLSIKVADVVDHPDFKAVLDQLGKTPEALDGVGELTGLDPREMDRVTIFFPALSRRGPAEPVLAITTREAFNEARVLKKLGAEPVFDAVRRNPHPEHGHDEARPLPGKSIAPPPEPPPVIKEPAKSPPPGGEDACSASEAAPSEPLFYELSNGPFDLLFLVDDRTLVFLVDDGGRGSGHLALLGQLLVKKPGGPLAEAIAAGGRHTLAAGIFLPPLLRDLDRDLPPDLAPYAALTAARTAVLTGDLDRSAKLKLTLSFDDEAAARRAAPVLEEGLKTLAKLAIASAAQMQKDRRPEEQAIGAMIESTVPGLKNAVVNADGKTVVATTEFEVGPAMARAAGELIQSIATRKKFMTRMNHLMQIGLALHSYHDAMGRLPTNVYNAKGEAILSWRVHLLPYLEQDQLYRRFKLDEPWDSANNKPLVEMMPRVFEVNGRAAPKGMTFLQGFVSPNPKLAAVKGAPNGRAWLIDGEKQGRQLHTIPDGTANTIAVVEARDAVIWSKPDDLPFGEKLPPLGAANAAEFFALFLDGHVAAIPMRIDPATMKALITTDGGEVAEIPGSRGRGEGLFKPKVNEATPPAKGGSGSGPPPKEKYEDLYREYEANEMVRKRELARLSKLIEELEAARIRQNHNINAWWKEYRAKK